MLKKLDSEYKKAEEEQDLVDKKLELWRLIQNPPPRKDITAWEKHKKDIEDKEKAIQLKAKELGKDEDIGLSRVPTRTSTWTTGFDLPR